MIFRIFLVLIFLSAMASFGYGFWLVLRPQDHQWTIDIPLDKRLPPRPRAEAEPSPDANRAQAADPTANQASDPAADPKVDSRMLIEALTPGASTDAGPGPRPITLALPIACDPGTDCWVMNFVDLDPGPGRADYRCNQMSYDGHKGTDIGLANDARIADDVPVLAAAAGTVIGARDGEPDAGAAGMAAARAAGKECGNGVRIDHGDGWATQYCHLREGSILVRAGQPIEAGQILGTVGLSGLTEFPHVHVSVFRGEEVIDPFRGVAGGPACSLGAQPLWDDETLTRLVAVEPPVLLDMAFSDGIPSSDDASKGLGAWDALDAETEAVVVWFRAAGMAPGDTARLTMLRPDGSVEMDQTLDFDRHQAAVFRALGVRNTTGRFPDGLPAGDWRGRVVLMRDGRVTADRTVTVPVFAARGDG